MLHGMELVVTLALVGGTAVLAPRIGHDSREGIQSNEEKLARLGYAWGAALPRPLEVRRAPIRRHIARALYALAAWLNPELTRVSRFEAEAGLS
jgi:hypothetical protein